MRFLTAAAAVALLTTSLAWAQPTEQAATQSAAPVPPTSCGELPATPTLPDGATATPDAMQTAQTTLQAFDTAYRANLDCRRREFEALAAQVQVRRDEYNTGATALNTTLQSWQAEIDEFNARQPRRRNRN